MNEFEYINRYFRPLVGKEENLLKDDAAIYKPKSNTDIIISTDSLSEGIHFFGTENPSDIAKKCLRVNLSDMAAMGAKPVFYNLAISIPKDKASTFIPAFAAGLEEDQARFKLKLIGGDLTSSLKHINITISIFGEVSSGCSIARDGAQLNDILYVTGLLGLSKIGLDNFSSNRQVFNEAKKKYLLPQPRVNLGIAVAKIATSMIDISDGLVQDSIHLATNSKLSLELNISNLPLPICSSLTTEEILKAALYGGDDYELLFSCKIGHDLYLQELAKKTNIKITKIGSFKEFKDVHLSFKGCDQIPKPLSYSHF
ncbi:thiamine-phosphate kinase [Alphaproteobacteria bacterium]|nr:thiamine-phosphate kinase [Alphaproteobacteria bacterium]MDC1023301.1 thiamine-phosphate kinase [Alphaproteobacteria bacterium]